MIFGTGIDLIEISRIKRSLDKYADRFETRIFTPVEIGYCRAKANPAKHFAARFAVKEAVLKSLGTGLSRGISWKDIEVVTDLESGKPSLRVTGNGEKIIQDINLKTIHISISHDQVYAIAQAVAEL